MGVTTTPATGESLVRRAATGDVEAFEELYRENIGRVYVLCLRMCGDPSLAEELAQKIEYLMQPENSWQVRLDENGKLIWVSGDQILKRQPAQSFWQRLQDVFLNGMTIVFILPATPATVPFLKILKAGWAWSISV